MWALEPISELVAYVSTRLKSKYISGLRVVLKKPSLNELIAFMLRVETITLSN